MISILSIWHDFHVDDKLEAELVRIIIEKVVEIREQSIKKATQDLIRKLEQPNKFKYNMKMYGNPRAGQKLKPLDMKPMVENSFEGADLSHFSEGITKGRATFKPQPQLSHSELNTTTDDLLRKEAPKKKKLMKKPKTQADILQENMRNKFMKNEEIKEICVKNNLTRMEVYDIRSQFTSMCMISEGFMGLIGGEGGNDEGDKGNSNKFKEPQKEGININYFIKNCSFLAGTLPHISKRLLAAIGVDVESSSTKIDWNTYLQLYCIFESGNIDKEALVKFWIKFFDPKLMGNVPEKEYMPLLEELIRGNALSQKNETTEMFARMF